MWYNITLLMLLASFLSISCIRPPHHTYVKPIYGNWLGLDDSDPSPADITMIPEENAFESNDDLEEDTIHGHHDLEITYPDATGIRFIESDADANLGASPAIWQVLSKWNRPVRHGDIGPDAECKLNAKELWAGTRREQFRIRIHVRG